MPGTLLRFVVIGNVNMTSRYQDVTTHEDINYSSVRLTRRQSPNNRLLA